MQRGVQTLAGGFRRVRLRALPAICCAALLAAAGCATVTTPQTPGDMNLDITLKDFQQGSTQVVARFSTTAGNTVQFVSGETVGVNGQFLKYDSNYVERLVGGGAYIGEVARQPDGGSYTTTYTPAQGTSAAAISVPVKVVSAPVHVLQPTSGAAVAIPKTSPLTITYEPSHLAHTTILVVATDSRAKVTFTLPEQETGTLSVQPNQFSEFQPGLGTLSLVRITDVPQNTSVFHHVSVSYQNISQFAITWR